MTTELPRLATPVATAASTAGMWTREVGRLLGQDDPDLAFGAIRAVLHALHRRLDADRTVALSDGLPTLLRGVLHEPLDGVGCADTRTGFLACVDRSTRHAVRPEEAVRAVCAVLAARLPSGVWHSVRDGLLPGVAALLVVPPHPDRPRRLVP